jgi:DNA transposition AAA+ family ATPase
MIARSNNQTPLDFILQVTGSVENLMSFLQSNNINYNQFYSKKNFNINYSSNDMVNTFKKRGITIGSKPTVSVGDFNLDYNIDFLN